MSLTTNGVEITEMTKYKVLAEKVIGYDVLIQKAGALWQYSIRKDGDKFPYTLALGILSKEDALANAKQNIEELEEVDRVRYSWEVS